jgi:hypothetical protein
MLSPDALFHSLRARAVGAAIGEKQGFMKVLIGANDDRILGFTMIGSEAGEVMAACHIRCFATPFSRTRPWPRDWVSSSPTCQLATCDRLRRNRKLGATASYLLISRS